MATSNKSGTQNEPIIYNAAAGTYSIRVNGVSGANNATLCYTLRATAAGAPAFISSPSAEALQQTVQGIKLYPNPARDIINIQLDKALPNARLSVFDMYGRTLISRTITGTLQTVDIRNLSQGTYHVKVISASGNEQYNLRLIKQ